jgi:hypothetical protein
MLNLMLERLVLTVPLVAELASLLSLWKRRELLKAVVE